MSWSLKPKIKQQGGAGYILTPNFLKILVGENEDKILAWKPGFNKWLLKGKNLAGSWTNKAKIQP